jgi:hypothetical protein
MKLKENKNGVGSVILLLDILVIVVVILITIIELLKNKGVLISIIHALRGAPFLKRRF